MPGLVEADDLGTYVLKFTGAGQGPKVLVAETIVTGLARALGIATPDIAQVELPEPIARYEADEEVQDLLSASIGPNLGIDFLPGALNYDGSMPPPADEAAAIVWLDALTANVDRTWSNPNLLTWHGETWCIDHGAALYFHHAWPGRGSTPERFAAQPFDASTHILRGVAGDVARLDDELAARLTPRVIEQVVASVPEVWIEPNEHLPSTDDVRRAYVDNLTARLADRGAWLPTGTDPDADARNRAAAAAPSRGPRRDRGFRQ